MSGSDAATARAGRVAQFALLAAGSMAVLFAVAAQAGFGSASIGGSQLKLFVLGLAVVALGALPLLPRVPDAEDVASRVRDWWGRAWPACRPDLFVGAGVSLVALLAGTAYVWAAKTGPVASWFYAPTLDPVGERPVLTALDALFPYGALFAIVGVLTWAVMRTAMGRVAALAVTAGFMTSPLHLYNLPPSIVRTYGKVPFVLMAVLLMAALLRRREGASSMALAAAGGAVLGLGSWVREDLLLFAVPFLAVVLAFCPRGTSWSDRLRASAVFLGVFAWFVAPQVYESLGRSALPAVGGLMSPLDGRLGVLPAARSLGYQFSDEFIYAVSHARAAALGQPGTAGYLTSVITHFPADLLVRAYGSALRVLEIPGTYVGAPLGTFAPLVTWSYAARAALVAPLQALGLPVAASALLLVAWRSPRKAAFAGLVGLFLAVYPSVQFLGRHYFHAEFVPWLAAGLVADRAVRGAASLLRDRGNVWAAWKTPRVGRHAIRVVVFAAAAAAALALPLAAARAYQSGAAGRDDASARGARSVDTTSHAEPGGSTLVSSAALTATAGVSTYAAVKVDPRAAGADAVALTLRYAPVEGGRPDYSHTLMVEAPPDSRGPVTVLAPLLLTDLTGEPGARPFEGFQVPAGQAAAIRGASVLERPGDVPVWYYSAGPGPAWQRLLGWEGGCVLSVPDTNGGEPDASPTGRIARIGPADVDRVSPAMTAVGGGWKVDGYVQPPPDAYEAPALDRSLSRIAAGATSDVQVGLVDTDLMLSLPHAMRRGDRFVARGRVRAGGALFSLLGTSGGGASGFVRVTGARAFEVSIAAPADGVYRLGLANDVDGYTSLENRVDIDEMGWVRGSR